MWSCTFCFPPFIPSHYELFCLSLVLVLPPFALTCFFFSCRLCMTTATDRAKGENRRGGCSSPSFRIFFVFTRLFLTDFFLYLLFGAASFRTITSPLFLPPRHLSCVLSFPWAFCFVPVPVLPALFIASFLSKGYHHAVPPFDFRSLLFFSPIFSSFLLLLTTINFLPMFFFCGWYN